MNALRTWIDIDTLPARRGMNADDGVDRLDGLPSHGASGGSGAIRLCDRTVNS